MSENLQEIYDELQEIIVKCSKPPKDERREKLQKAYEVLKEFEDYYDGLLSE